MITRERLKDMPQSPGVYLMKGNKGEVLYIGKAKNIRNRVRSYFQETSDTRHTIKFLASKIHDIEYLVTTNEKEAIILEDTLLKKYKPRYNIRLKDDKTYVSIKLTLQEKFPRILIIRQIKKDGSRYFGPYPSAQKARETVRFVRHIFPLCTCSPSEFKNRVRPCLDYQLGICSAPCVNFISETAYKELVDKTTLFLEGRNKELLSELKANMSEASHAMSFEKAAKIRDQIKAIEATLEEQKVVSQKKIDQDIFAHIIDEETLLIQALFVRDGRLSGARDFFFSGQKLPADEALSSFISQYYSGDRFIPDEIILSLNIEDKDVIEDWLTEKKGKPVPAGSKQGKVRFFFPTKGERFKLFKMAEANAKEAIKRKQETLESKQALLEELKRRLHLRKTPKTIEAFDISNVSGKMAVGAMVTFEDVKPNKDRYRLYKIKTLEEPDDYGMMSEVLSRRYKEGSRERNLPDLILIDGGKGQLNIAVKVMDELEINDIDIAAIAKEHPPLSPLDKGGIKGGIPGEKIYLPNIKDPIILKEGSSPDLLIRKIRDEAHRFAISYHIKLRGKIKSALDEIPGIGKAKRNTLLKHFGSVEKIREASMEEIAKLSGITAMLAEAIKKALSAHG
ncbi:MAG: excinuclease ABC subunit C [Deltaproteobacteria bacterium RIFCSPLOWO2_12_FULL_43_16]|nr:MAG: excinuclease ABC subunit C [Deltaproteobacteria bacterium GWA2_43_19]OGQ12681.1 MAG: excinuclease ABC subunit C [Deltaproteobacteria bacterium RIFCSPHIGHO2_02_FULL_43_33]OGQ57031.1 MAG: excinuclease ABC subunit C [Deltaproteobacteria bacterium RIFCSPLOWO2_12_FULL_43_16]